MRVLTFDSLRAEKGIVYSRMHISRMVKAGQFPQPINLSEARIAWIEAEVDRWIEQRASFRKVA